MKNLQLLMTVVALFRDLRKKSSSLLPLLRFNPLILQQLVDRFLPFRETFTQLLFQVLSLKTQPRIPRAQQIALITRITWIKTIARMNRNTPFQQVTPVFVYA